MIDEVVFLSKGSHSWYDVYNYPIWLRKFTYKRLIDRYTPEEEALPIKKGNKESHVIQKRVFNPSYNTKVSKK